MIGQLSVQAGDFSILAIAVVTLLTVKRTVYMPDASIAKKVAICLAVWVIPLATSITATALGEMTVVGGNWCWISGARNDLRYGLTHGWRFLVIFSTVAIYLYIWAHLRNHFKSLQGSQRWTYHSTESSVSNINFGDGLSKGDTCQQRPNTGIELETSAKPGGRSFGSQSLSSQSQTVVGQPSPMNDEYFKDGLLDADDDATLDEMIHDRPARSLKHKKSLVEDIERITPATPYQAHLAAPVRSRQDVTATNRTSCSEFPIRRESHQAEREIKRMMLLNAYPIAYIILWIPGLINRLLEATGHPASARLAASLQVSTQFIGFANALTYGFNHHLRDRLKDIYVTKMRGGLRRRRRR
jgi:slime mold cyclic AMP receptor